jgi:hypothetical protein
MPEIIRSSRHRLSWPAVRRLAFAGPAAAGLALAAAVAPAAMASAATAALPSNCTQSGATVTCTYDYTGAPVTWAVPSGLSFAALTLYGGSGGDGATGFSSPLVTATYGSGGQGAEVTGTVSLSGISSLTLNVAGAGQVSGGGGYGGGGTATAWDGGGGGGATTVSDSAGTLLVAGGGGGGGAQAVATEINSSQSNPFSGGAGGNGGNAGQPGQPGAEYQSLEVEAFGSGGGGAGTQTVGGAGGKGGTGADTDNTIPFPKGQSGEAGSSGNGGGFPNAGGAGGGGYFGGGQAGGATVCDTTQCNYSPTDSLVGSFGGGGGGSSFTAGPGVSAATVNDSPGTQDGSNGQVVISYNTAPVTTTTTVSSSANPSVIGQPVTYTATISQAPGGGTVGFTDNGTPITGCTAVPVSGSTATCQATPASGANTIAATFTGSVGFGGSAGTLTQEAVLPTTTTTTLSSSANPSVIGQPVTYTATISQAPGGGTVGFTDNGTPITGCTAVPVSGSTATCQATPASGANTIAATFTGSVGFGGSAGTLTQEAVLPPCVTLIC